jgi:prepilin-type N-terminal cleavage/methylation domain-containing protein
MGRLRETTRGAGGERGFTLVEMLISSVLGLLVVGAGVALFTSAIQSQPRVSDRAAQIQQARTMAERISRELRQGSDAEAATSAQLMILTYVPRTVCGLSPVGPATKCKVFYTVDGAGTAIRTECLPTTLAPPVGCGLPVEVVSGLADNQVFGFSPKSPGHGFVSLRLAFPATPSEDAITIEDGVALRNPPVGSS